MFPRKAGRLRSRIILNNLMFGRPCLKDFGVVSARIADPRVLGRFVEPIE
jgi:hypothetical protein